MNAIALNAVELSAPITGEEMAYARRPWLRCGYSQCGRNLWRKASANADRTGRIKPDYCNSICREAAFRERQRTRYKISPPARKRRRRMHLSIL